MLTKLFNKLKGSRSVIATTNVFNAPTTTSGFLYVVTLPNVGPVTLRAKNQVEAKALVRDAHGLKRLPTGTTVTRMG